jgi:hypothetical protein
MAKTESYYFRHADCLSLAPGFSPVLSRDEDNQAVLKAYR